MTDAKNQELHGSEFEKFDAVMRMVLSVSHDELKKREKKYQRQRAKLKKTKRVRHAN